MLVFGPRPAVALRDAAVAVAESTVGPVRCLVLLMKRCCLVMLAADRRAQEWAVAVAGKPLGGAVLLAKVLLGGACRC